VLHPKSNPKLRKKVHRGNEINLISTELFGICTMTDCAVSQWCNTLHLRETNDRERKFEVLRSLSKAEGLKCAPLQQKPRRITRVAQTEQKNS